MTQDEIKALTDAVAKGGDTLTNYVKGLKATEPEIKLDGVKKFLEENEEGKTYLQSLTNKGVTDGIESFKKNNLQKLVEDEYKKQHPEINPTDLETEKLKKQIEQMQKDGHIKDNKNNALKILAEKKLPTSLVDFLVTEDEKVTKANIDTFAKAMGEHDNSVKTELLKNSSYVPPVGGGSDDKPGSIAKKIIEQNKNVTTDMQQARDSYFK
jgi:hypothetical protein